jgi:phosphoserine phosphatase RsbU/P
MTEVAGDFYDFIVVDEKRIGTLVADVSGHGMPAALISSMLKIALAAQTPVASDPALVLNGLNQALCGKFQGHFVTAAYIFIDTEKHTLRYAGAGHPPLVLRDQATGETRELLENGLFLGAFAHATYAAVETPFHEGTWALLYTDGILEMTNAAEEEYGGERLNLFAKEDKCSAAADFADRLLNELSIWGDRALGHKVEDDVTLLVIHFEDRAGEKQA